MIISKTPLFLNVAADAPPVGDTRVLSVLFFLYMFVAACGVLQIISAYNHMKAFSFFKKPAWAYVFGICAIVGMNLMFFLTGDRNVEQPRLEGAQTISISFLAFVAAVFLTLLLAWFIKRKETPDSIETDYPEGMEALERHTYVPLIKRLWARLGRRS
jgi:hypothetical protein